MSRDKNNKDIVYINRQVRFKGKKINIFDRINKIKKDLKELLEKEAKLEEISLAELCREKLRHNSRLVRIEFMLEKLNKQIEK